MKFVDLRAVRLANPKRITISDGLWHKAGHERNLAALEAMLQSPLFRQRLNTERAPVDGGQP